MKIFKTILCIIFSIEVLLAITMFLVNNDVMYVVIGIIFAFLAFWSFKSSRKHKKKGHQNNDESFDIDSAIKTLSNEIASSIQFSVPELTEQQQRDLEKVKEMQEASPNPKYRRTPREEDLSFDFEEKWGSQIHFLEAEMQKKYSAATQAQDYDTAIDLAKEALTLYQTLKTFCYQKGKGGEIYFQDIWEYMHNSDSEVFSYKDTIDSRIAYWEEMRTLKEETLSLIASKRGELLQKDIYSLLPSHGKSDIQKIIRELESDGLIHREKKGSTYLLIAK